VKGAQFFQQCEIAGALRSETKVLADQEPARLEPFRDHLFDDASGASAANERLKPLNVHAFHPCAASNSSFSRNEVRRVGAACGVEKLAPDGART